MSRLHQTLGVSRVCQSIFTEELKPTEKTFYRELRAYNNCATDSDTFPNSLSKLLFRVAHESNALFNDFKDNNMEQTLCMKTRATNALGDCTVAPRELRPLSKGLRRIPKEHDLASLAAVHCVGDMTNSNRRKIERMGYSTIKV